MSLFVYVNNIYMEIVNKTEVQNIMVETTNINDICIHLVCVRIDCHFGLLFLYEMYMCLLWGRQFS